MTNIGFLLNELRKENEEQMTNIKFLVNELRKANETIEQLRKENERINAEKRNVMANIEEILRLINKLAKDRIDKIQLCDIDTLAALKKKMKEISNPIWI